MTRRLRASALLLGLAVAACRAPSAVPPDAAPAPRFSLPAGLQLESACVGGGPEMCFDARDDNCNGIIDEGCGVRTGAIQFAIAWRDPEADVDLEVTDPAGEVIEVGRVAQSGLVKERDCPGRGNECHGQNLENVYLDEGEPPRGRYRVKVRLEKAGHEAPPLRVTLGARVGPKAYAAVIELVAAGDLRQLDIDL